MKEEFPVGVPIQLTEIDEFNQFVKDSKKCPKFGIFRVEYKANKNLVDSILPRRENGKLIWDLNDGEGIYNSVDIDNALNCGYQIEIKEGWYWNETAKVFDS